MACERCQEPMTDEELGGRRFCAYCGALLPRYCDVCGEPFRPRQRGQLRCSFACQQDAKRYNARMRARRLR